MEQEIRLLIQSLAQTVAVLSEQVAALTDILQNVAAGTLLTHQELPVASAKIRALGASTLALLEQALPEDPTPDQGRTL